jgi:hypothetical protein
MEIGTIPTSLKALLKVGMVPLVSWWLIGFNFCSGVFFETRYGHRS